MVRFLCVFMVLLLATPPAWAQDNVSETISQFKKDIIKAQKKLKDKKAGKEQAKKEKRDSDYSSDNYTSSIKMRRGDNPAPLEPDIPVVTYLKIDPPKTLQQRVEYLLHNIYIDVPPEYDHYGYEIRRYMARIGGPNVLGNKTALLGQIQNIKNAKIILGYWRRALDTEITAIEKELEESGAPSSTRSTFRYNKAVVYAFLTECNQWIMHNKALNEYLVEITGGYKYIDPEFTFYKREYRRKFIALHSAREAAREQIIEYTLFQSMVY